MADLTQGVSTYQGGTNDTATILVNNVSPMNANQMNGAYDAIVQMQAILGAGPDLKGSTADLATRLAVQMSASGILLPIGSIILHGGALPSLFINADGSAISRTGIYANLFAVYGTTFGPGDGSTTFNVPNFSGRIPVGLGAGVGGGSSGTGAPTGGSALANILMGAWRGEENHLLTGPESGIQQHTHLQNAHTHEITKVNGTHNFGNPGKIVGAEDGGGQGSSTQTSGSTTAVNQDVANTNAVNSHNVINPQLGIRFIIKY